MDVEKCIFINTSLLRIASLFCNGFTQNNKQLIRHLNYFFFLMIHLIVYVYVYVFLIEKMSLLAHAEAGN